MTQKKYFPPQTSGQRRFSSWQPPSRNSARKGIKIDHKLPQHTDKSTNQASFFQKIAKNQDRLSPVQHALARALRLG